MGITTSYVGHVVIEPPLSAAETAYLTTFAETRHNHKLDGTFALPANPLAAAPPVSGDDAYRPDRVAADRPSFWCPWTPCSEGHCLRPNGLDCTSPGEAWLRYLIDVFLRRSAKGRSDTSGALQGFTFDHNCNGVIVGSPNDTDELYALHVRNNRVRREQLMGGLFSPPWETDMDWRDEIEQRRADRDGSWERWLRTVEADALSGES